MSKSNGFTLVELLVGLAILAIILLLSLPSLDHFITKTKVDNEISTIHRLLLLARNTAINTDQIVTLCPLDSGNNCSGQWHKDLSVFIDQNNNKTFETTLNERILFVKSEIPESFKLQYGTTRIGVSYAPTGVLAGWGQNATFMVCPKSKPGLSRGVTVAVSGRAYASSKVNNKGLEKNRSGKVISCD